MGLRLGPLGANALHVAIDMQRLFAETTAWHTPALAAIIPVVTAISERFAEQTLFTRFITPRTPTEAHGAWRHYFQHWRSVALDTLDPALLALVEPLSRLAPPAAVIDKTAYSAFTAPAFAAALAERRVDTLIVSGVETDVCVLATVLDAIDAGYRVIVVADAVASFSAAGHRAVLEAVLPRFDQQVETVSATELLGF